MKVMHLCVFPLGIFDCRGKSLLLFCEVRMQMIHLGATIFQPLIEGSLHRQLLLLLAAHYVVPGIPIRIAFCQFALLLLGQQLLQLDHLC